MPDNVRTAAILSTAPTPWGELGVVCIDRAGEAGALHVVHRTSDHRTPPPLQVVSISGPGERPIRTGGGSSASDGTLFQQFGLVGLPPDAEPASVTLALWDSDEPSSDSAAVVVHLALPPAQAQTTARKVRSEPAGSSRWEVAWRPNAGHLDQPMSARVLPDDYVAVNAVAPDVGGTTLTVLALERWDDRWYLRLHAASDRLRWLRQLRALQVDSGEVWADAWMTSGNTSLGGLTSTFRLPHPPGPELRLRLPGAPQHAPLFDLAADV